CPSPVSECLAVLGPCFDADPAAVVVSGRVVNMLNRDRSVLVNALDSNILQSVCIDTSAVPKRSVVCTQNHQFHLFSLSKSSQSPTLLHLGHGEGRLVWQPVELAVTAEAASALQDIEEWGSSCTLANQLDGSVHVVITHVSMPDRTLRLDAPSRTLSLLATHSKTDTESFVVSPVAAKDSSARTPCDVGTIIQLGSNLHLSVLNSTCVHICGTVLQYAVQGRQQDQVLLYSSQDSDGVSLHRVSLAQFRGTPQLPLSAETVPSVHTYDWIQTVKMPAGSAPTLRCRTSTGCYAIWLGQDLRVLSLLRYTPHGRWERLSGDGDITDSVPPVSPPSSCVYHRGSVFGNVQGQLVRVDISTATAFPLTLSLLPAAQPRVATNGDALILSTPTGDRVYSLSPAERVGTFTVEAGVESVCTGLHLSGACVDGAICVGDTYMRMVAGVALPMIPPSRTQETESTQPQRHIVTSLAALTSLLDAGVGQEVDVVGTPEEPVVINHSLAQRPLTDCSFTHCQFTSLAGAQLTHCHFKSCAIAGADLSGVCMGDCSFEACDLSGATLSNAILNHLSFDERCVLTSMGLQHSTLADIDFCDLNISGCNFHAASFERVNTAGADCTGVVLSSVKLKDTSILGPCGGILHSASDVTDIDLSGCDLSAWCFDSLDLTGCNFSGCNVSGASFVGTTLCNTNLTGAQGLQDSQLRAAHNTSGIVLCGHNMNGWNLHGINLHSANLISTDLSGANLREASLADALLAESDLSLASLTGVRGLTASQLKAVKTVKGADLSGIDLSGQFLGALNLTDCVLHGVNLAGGNLMGAVLRGCVGMRIVLEDARLESVEGLRKDILRHAASLQSLTIKHCSLHGFDLSGLDMTCATFDGCKLTELNLDNANLSHSVFTNCELNGSFTLTNLSQSVMTLCRLPRTTDLTTADLTAVNWDGSNLIARAWVDGSSIHHALLPIRVRPGWGYHSTRSVTGRGKSTHTCHVPSVLNQM
ncbi:hypothetical protein KIPB_007863, partial [Kipferlia bialata]